MADLVFIQDENMQIEAQTNSSHEISNFNLKEKTIWCTNCESYKKIIVISDSDAQDNTCPHCKALCEYCMEKDRNGDSKFCEKCEKILDSNQASPEKLASSQASLFGINISSSPIDYLDSSSDASSYVSNSDTALPIVPSLSSSPINFLQAVNILSINEPSADFIDSIVSSISTACKKIVGGLGSDGTIGSGTNGILSDAGCKVIASRIPKGSSVLDIGSSDGSALLKIVAASGSKAGVGIEREINRYQLAMSINAKVMNDISTDIPVHFVFDDVKVFNSFNGFTHIYMYDKEFVPETMEYIKLIFNRSHTVEAIFATKNLEDYGFEVTKSIESLPRISAAGGKMSALFYEYRRLNVATSEIIPDKRNEELLEISLNRVKRFNSINSNNVSFSRSRPALRSNAIKRSLQEPDFVSQSGKLYSLLINKEVVNGRILTSYKKSKGGYAQYEEKDLATAGKLEFAALCATHYQQNKALVVPSFNGIDEILIGLHYVSHGGGRYIAVIYFIKSETFHEVAIKDAWSRFDFELSMPFDMAEIEIAYRKLYPLLDTTTSSTVSSTGRKRNLRLDNVEEQVNIQPAKRGRPTLDPKDAVLKKKEKDLEKLKNETAMLRAKLKETKANEKDANDRAQLLADESLKRFNSFQSNQNCKKPREEIKSTMLQDQVFTTIESSAHDHQKNIEIAVLKAQIEASKAQIEASKAQQAREDEIRTACAESIANATNKHIDYCREDAMKTQSNFLELVKMFAPNK